MIDNLIFIGTVHSDSKLKKRLEKLLSYLNPDIITVEYTNGREREEKKFYQSILNILKKKGIGEEVIKEYIPKIENESTICMDYAQEKEISCFFIDKSTVAVKNLLFLTEMKTLRKITQMKISRKMGKKSKDKMERVMKREPKTGKLMQKIFDSVFYNERNVSRENKYILQRVYGDDFIGKRDEYMAESLNTLSEFYPNKKIVHVGGFSHLANHDSDTTVVNLGKLFPESEKYLLPQADSL